MIDAVIEIFGEHLQSRANQLAILFGYRIPFHTVTLKHHLNSSAASFMRSAIFTPNGQRSSHA